MTALVRKMLDKGVYQTALMRWRRWVFDCTRLYVLDRSLELPIPFVRLDRDPVPVTQDNLYIFDRYFSSYIPSIRDFIRQGSIPVVYLDEEQNAIGMIWIHEESGHYNDSYYKCSIPIPEGSIYLFAAELAKHLRMRDMALLYGGQFRIWKEYMDRGYTSMRTIVDERNVASLNIQLRLGFKEAGCRIHAYRMFGLLRWSRTKRYGKPRFNRKARDYSIKGLQ